LSQIRQPNRLAEALDHVLFRTTDAALFHRSVGQAQAWPSVPRKEKRQNLYEVGLLLEGKNRVAAFGLKTLVKMPHVLREMGIAQDRSGQRE